jgi:murein DD-endopeptidase MepM/ murein hydrolase activator NlpD
MSRHWTPTTCGGGGFLLLALVLACTNGPQEPARDPFLAEIQAAEAAIDRGQLDEAHARLDQAAGAAANRGRQSPERARLHLDRARLYRMTGESRSARHHLGLARFATRSSHGMSSREMAEVEVESSLQQQAAGSHKQAVASLLEALRIRRRLLARDDPELARTLTALAYAHQLAFDYPPAVGVMRAGLDALERWPDSTERTRLLLVNRNRLAWIYERASLHELADEQRTLSQRAWSTAGFEPAAPKSQLGLTGLPSDSGETSTRTRELMGFAREWILARRIAEEHFSLEALMLGALRRLDRGASTESARAGLVNDLRSASIAFAPVSGRSKHRGHYLLPFDGRVARRVATDHLAHAYQKVYLHAVDFEMPPGSSVLAARNGVVARVASGFSREDNGDLNASDQGHGEGVNSVTILHEDGTYASYLPLAPGLRVWEGLEVSAGDVIGESALTASGARLLHFDVRRNVRSSGNLLARPVRISFESVGGSEGVPLAGQSYGAEGTSTPAARGYRNR